jgi:hypothetical protein
MSDEPDPPTPADDPLRLLRELLDRGAEATRTVLSASARGTPDILSGPLADYLEGMARLTEAVTGPLQQLLAEQQLIAERMAEWAEEHRRLSEEIATWAERHWRTTEQMQRLIRPALDQAHHMAEATRGYVDELRQ